jgi:pyruvate formate lyase activating enzyme
MLNGAIFDIKRYAINDGPGIRTTVFFKGCPLDCWWCHNPESRTRQPQMMYRKNRCSSCGECVFACPNGVIHLDGIIFNQPGSCQDCGECARVCVYGARELVGRTMTVEQVMAEIERDVVFYDQSGGGVTFSGGEPLIQRKFLMELLRCCKEHEIHTTLDTSGYAAWKMIAEAAQLTDLFLYDLKCIDDEKHKRYTGVSNRSILSNLQRLTEAGAAVIVRIPLIPGINDDEDNLIHTQQFLAGLPGLVGVEVLPYHDIARAKYATLGLEYRLPGTITPTLERLEWALGVVGNY